MKWSKLDERASRYYLAFFKMCNFRGECMEVAVRGSSWERKAKGSKRSHLP
jgi:hypothetical protein